MDRRDHWEEVYAGRSPLEVSWYQREPTTSLDLIEAAGTPKHAGIVDVGGGASTLVDHLLGRGFTDLTVMDLAGRALAAAEERLGERGEEVDWLEADVTAWQPARQYALWHDRAVFHFLVDPTDRARYRATAEAALPSGAHLIIATFAPEGPEKCSGLPVARYDAPALATELGEGFHRLESRHETHQTPGGAEQAFGFHLFQRV
ncbi:MAG: class I SAM-dependent methyltransferase [Pseudomonadota bacterium]